ncbi:MAG: hypothetical protein CMJ24_06595 [Phycisphaerae bacterium]|nr:hypothetical protein [Phycisphaerae bacterium]|tara:strand:+ start:5528 stop:6856 length:1329 start_codon:yes stop_codon:yes gene_type:complete
MNGDTRIPMPPRRWLLRFGLPVLVLAAAAALLLSMLWTSIVPAREITAVPTVVRDVEIPFDAAGDDQAVDEAVVQAPGWVEPDPYGIYAGALVEGVVKELLVLEGDPVKTGQPVATLVDDEARIALQRAKANVLHLHAEMLMVEATRDQLPSRLDAARARLSELEDEIRRKTPLVEQGAVAEGPVERLKIRVRAAEAAIAELEVEKKRLDAAVMDAKAELAVGESDRDDAMLTLQRMTVRSPIDGVVVERLTSPGSVIRFGNGEHSSHIVHLYQPEKLQVRADIPLANAAMVRRGQPADVVVDIMPGKVFRGEVTRFVHRADLSKNTVEAKVRIIDPSPLLKPDMLARVRILPARDREAGIDTIRIPRTFAPEQAIVDGVAWVIESRNGTSGTAGRRAVTTGTSEHDGWIEVIDGLQPGDFVILQPQGLREGDRVQMTGDRS